MRTEERVSISAFVDPDDQERLAERARAEDRSVSAELRLAIKQHSESAVRLDLSSRSWTSTPHGQRRRALLAPKRIRRSFETTITVR